VLAVFRNQYVIAERSARIASFDHATPHEVGQWAIWSFDPLSVAVANSPGMAIAVIGVAVDSDFPNSDTDDLVQRMLKRSGGDVGRAEILSHDLTGRFVCVAAVGSELFVWGDACHLRQIFYGSLGGCRLVSSSERLMLDAAGVPCERDSQVDEFRRSTAYLANEHALIGDRTSDRRILRVLPNHMLSTEAMGVNRVGLRVSAARTDETLAADEVLTQIRGAIDSLTRRYDCVQAVTGGWDSRVLLAASLPFAERIEFFLFDHGDASSAADVRIARELCASAEVPLVVVRPGELSQAFRAQIEAEHLDPRVLQKTADVQFHAERPGAEGMININGNVAEIARCYYGIGMWSRSLKSCSLLLGYPADERFVASSLEPWLPAARRLETESGVRVPDLLYWEHRMGTWGARSPFEIDLGLEEVSPFNCKRLLLQLLGVPPRQRSAPNFEFFGAVVRRGFPGAMAVPVNPQTPRWRLALKRYTMVQETQLRVRSTLR